MVSGIFFKRKLERSEFFLIFLPFAAAAVFVAVTALLWLPVFKTVCASDSQHRSDVILQRKYEWEAVCIFDLLYLPLCAGLYSDGNGDYYQRAGAGKDTGKSPGVDCRKYFGKSVLFLVGLLVWRLIYLSKTRKKHSVLYWMQILLIPFCMILNLGLVLFT